MIVNNKQIIKILRKKYFSEDGNYDAEMDGDQDEEDSIGEEGDVMSPPLMQSFGGVHKDSSDNFNFRREESKSLGFRGVNQPKVSEKRFFPKQAVSSPFI